MKSICINLNVLLLLLIVVPGLLWADCESDYQNANALATKALQNQKNGQFQQAQKLYKTAARKLSGMKYRCSGLNLQDLRKKEHQYRLLARQTKCGTMLQNAQSLIYKGKSTYEAKGDYQVHIAKAAELYKTVITQCDGSAYGSLAKKKMDELANFGQASAVKKIPEEKRFKRVRARQGSCFHKHLRHVVAMENAGTKAYQQKRYSQAVANYTNAARLYVEESQKCKNPKDRLFALDKSKNLKNKIAFIRKNHVNCDEIVGEAKLSKVRADQDEKAGDFDLARYGYMKAYKAFVVLPKVCSPQNYSAMLEESRDRSKLLACEVYVNGLKAYRQAFKAMHEARHEQAARHYREAGKAFAGALSSCGFVGENLNVTTRMKKTSDLNASRLAN